LLSHIRRYLKEKKRKRKTIFEKEKKRKRNINNNLAVLPSHDSTSEMMKLFLDFKTVGT